MPPSMACSQFDSCRRLDTKRCRSGTDGELPFRQRRLLLRRPHIGPQHAAALDQRIGFELDLLAEAAFLRLRRHVDALPGHVVFPAMIGAAQAGLLVAAEPQRDAAMGAELVDQAEPAVAVAERQQALGQNLHPHRRAVVSGQFLGEAARAASSCGKAARRACRGRSGSGDRSVLFAASLGSLAVVRTGYVVPADPRLDC